MGGIVQLGPDALRLQPLHLAASVPAGSAISLKHKVGQDATLVSMRIRIYAGPQLALQLKPYVINARGQRRELVRYVQGGKQFLDGDDDTLVFALSEPIDTDSDETICVDATNTDPQYAYDFAVTVSLDYSNGQFPGVNARG